MQVIKSQKDYIAKDEIKLVIDHNLASADQLFDAFRKALQFPDYFGFNWNALVDMMRDLSWLKGKGVSILVTSLAGLNASDIKNLIEILAMCDVDEPSGEYKPLSKVHVYFHENVVKKLNSTNPHWVYRHLDSGL